MKWYQQVDYLRIRVCHFLNALICQIKYICIEEKTNEMVSTHWLPSYTCLFNTRLEADYNLSTSDVTTVTYVFQMRTVLCKCTKCTISTTNNPHISIFSCCWT